jgi:hypothetical protein
MKTLIAALTLATLDAAPRSERGEAAGQTSGGTYHGYPLSEWYRDDGW